MMKKNLLFILAFVIFGMGLVGCSGEEKENETESHETGHETEEHAGHSSNPIDLNDLSKDDVIGHIGGVEMNGEDLFYEMKRLELIYALSEDDTEATPNVAIQEFIRNHMIHQLAQGQNITVDEAEQEERALAVKEDIISNVAYANVMEDVDENEFWTRETERYEVILEAEELIALLMEQVKEKNPDYTEQALRFEAQEDLEEWIQEEIAETEIHLEEIVG